MPYQQLGSFSWQNQVWTYSVLNENMFGLVQFRVIISVKKEGERGRDQNPRLILPYFDDR